MRVLEAIFGAITTAVTDMRAQAYGLENVSGNIANSQTTSKSASSAWLSCTAASVTSLAPDPRMLGIRVDVVLAAEKAPVVLLGPACIAILLAQFGWLLRPFRRRPATLHGVVLVVTTHITVSNVVITSWSVRRQMI
jgi:hypothetical protein